jgi:hypothetical protein
MTISGMAQLKILFRAKPLSSKLFEVVKDSPASRDTPVPPESHRTPARGLITGTYWWRDGWAKYSAISAKRGLMSRHLPGVPEIPIPPA